jgi:hypothetical protein
LSKQNIIGFPLDKAKRVLEQQKVLIKNIKLTKPTRENSKYTLKRVVSIREGKDGCVELIVAYFPDICEYI